MTPQTQPSASPPVSETSSPFLFNSSLQGLRGLAASMVFAFHIFDMSRKLFPVPLPAAIQAFFNSLPSGVDIFFMISGYLIIGSLIRHRRVRNFLLDRAARIYPVFLVIHLLLFATSPVFKYKWMSGITLLEWTGHFLSNLLFLPGLFPLPIMQPNA